MSGAGEAPRKGGVLRSLLGWLARTLLEGVAVGLGVVSLLAALVLAAWSARAAWGPLVFVPATLAPALVLAAVAWRQPPWRARGAAWHAARLWLPLALGAAVLAFIVSGGGAWGAALGLSLVAPGVLGGWGLVRRLRGLDVPPRVRPRAVTRPASPPLGWPEVEVEEGALHVVRYPYAPASVAPGGVRLGPERITAVYGSWGPAVVLDGREVVFLPVSQREALARFAERHGLARPRIPDVWALLAEPFIDQPYTAEDEARDGARLAELGFSGEEVRALRREVGPLMLTATLYTMEWGGYSAEDVLRAWAVLRPGALTAERYAWLMRIALRPYAALRERAGG